MVHSKARLPRRRGKNLVGVAERFSVRQQALYFPGAALSRWGRRPDFCRWWFRRGV